MRLNLKFRERAAQIGVWLTTEFDQILAAIRGSWLVEHTEDDSHSDIHAYSLTLTPTPTSTQTGTVTAGGDGIFAGKVSAKGGAIVLSKSQRPGSTTPDDQQPTLRLNDWLIYADSLNTPDCRFEWTHPLFNDGGLNQFIALWARITGGNLELKGAPLAGSATISFPIYRGGEGGSWTPDLKIAGSAVGITYGARTGTWRRVCDLLLVDFSLTLTSKGAGAGAVTITGLTTAAASIGTGALDPVAGTNASLTSAPYLVANGTTLFPVFVAAGVRTQLTDAEITNVFQCQGSVVYRV